MQPVWESVARLGELVELLGHQHALIELRSGGHLSGVASAWGDLGYGTDALIVAPATKCADSS